MALKEHIAARIAATERDARKDPANYRGHDWFQLSDEEAAVFGIDRARWPRLLVAWQLYQAFLNIVAPRDHELDEGLIAAERAARPELFDNGVMSWENFRTLAMEAAGLTEAQARAVYVKQEFWEKRDSAGPF